MTEMTVDLEDLIAYPIFLAGSMGQLGYLDMSVAGVSASDALYTLTADGFTTQLTIGFALAAVALGYVLFTNDLGFSGWSAMQTWLILVVLWMILSPPFVPLMDVILLGSDLGSFLAFAMQSLGFLMLLYIG